MAEPVLHWPSSLAADALQALASRTGLVLAASPRASLDASDQTELTAGERLRSAAAEACGCEVVTLDLTGKAIEAAIAGAAPAIVASEAGEVWAILRASNKALLLLCPDLRVRRIAPRRLALELRRQLVATLDSELAPLLSEMPGVDAERARAALQQQRLQGRVVAELFMLRPGDKAALAVHARQAGMHRHLLAVIGAQAIQYGLWLLAWSLVGGLALRGQLDASWIWVWLLILVSIIPCRMVALSAEGRFAIAAGTLFRGRLLNGLLSLTPESVRQQGAGQLLSKVLEASAIEKLCISGGMSLITALIEAGFASFVLGSGAGGALPSLIFVAWIAGALLLAWRYARMRSSWADERLRLTEALVEQMLGHRTRLAQLPRQRWHDREDALISRYMNRSRALDAASLPLLGLMARGWLVAGTLAVLPAFAAGGSSISLAVALGGILLGWQALDRLGFGLSQLADAWIAWRRVRELMGAADTAPQPSAPPCFSPSRAKHRLGAPSKGPVFETVRMSFQHASSSRPLLDSVSFTIRSGERLLLEGASGEGKSTLAALIAGLRAPTSGALLAGGIDRQTLGASGWRQRVAMAAQFHENHVITESFAFNLLLGRRWPPSAEDIDLAEAVCRELGLGELLERMPGGMFQMVGETAWQLSHGERSRLFLARALLQEPDLCVLDESLAALDPENLSLAIACLEKRAHSVLAIAHP